MDINRLKKLSGLNEKRPGDRGFTPGVQEPADRLKKDRGWTPGVQEPADRLKKDRGWTPGAPEPGQEPGDRGFIPGAPQVPPMPTPDKPNPKPSPGGPRPDRPKPQPKIPTAPGRRGLPDFDGTKLIHMPPPDWDGWDEFRDPKKIPGPALPKKVDDPVIKSPSLRDYLKNIRRS